MTADQFHRRPVVIAAMLVAFVAAIVVAAELTGGHHTTGHRVLTVTPPTAPAAVIGTKAAPPKPTTTQLRKARSTAQRFLAGYLPVLYGRRPARMIVAASRHVKAALAAAAKTPRAPRKRRPRVTQLSLHIRSSSTVVATAMISDSVVKPYQIAFQLSHNRHGWLVTQLANY